MRRPSIADFIEDELLRAPLLFDAVIDVVVDEWRQVFNIGGRSGGELARMLRLRRNDMLAAALGSLRAAVNRGQPVSAERAPKPRLDQLSLVDENDVVADLEIGRCAAQIASDAEAELRDVHAYTSSLVGDFAVSRETNPFRAEAFARAYWDGCASLPAAQPVRLDAFRRGIAPIARCVRSALAAACQRLAAQGVEPATYRTLIFPPGSGTAVPERIHCPVDDLTALRDSMLGSLDGPAARSSAGKSSDAVVPPPAATTVEQMMARLYVEICAEGGLPVQVVTLLLELRPAFERIAARDPGLIDRFDHPVWRFIDRIAHITAFTPPAERSRLVGLARNLIGHLAADPTPPADRFAWASEKIDAHDRQALELAVQGSAEEIQRLGRSVATAPAVEPGAQALDIHTLDTVPDEMLDQAASRGSDRGALGTTAPGDRVRMFLQGEWRTLQLLWSGGDLWLLRDLAGDRRWALRAAAVDRLAAERLATPLRMRSLARRAAERLQAKI